MAVFAAVGTVLAHQQIAFCLDTVVFECECGLFPEENKENCPHTVHFALNRIRRFYPRNAELRRNVTSCSGMLQFSKECCVFFLRKKSFSTE